MTNRELGITVAIIFTAIMVIGTTLTDQNVLSITEAQTSLVIMIITVAALVGVYYLATRKTAL